MTYKFNEDQFVKDIYTFPKWIVTEDQLREYINFMHNQFTGGEEKFTLEGKDKLFNQAIMLNGYLLRRNYLKDLTKGFSEATLNIGKLLEKLAQDHKVFEGL